MLSIVSKRRDVLRSMAIGWLVFSATTLSTPTEAHGPSRLKVTESVTIAATPEKVWEVIGDYAGMHKWLPMVESSTADASVEAGAKRTLTLGEGVEVHEELKSYDAAGMSYKYKIPDATHDIKILPVTNYAATISVKANDNGDGSVVTWKGGFYRGYPNYDPPEDQNDETALKVVTELYKAGLNNLKQLIEAD